MPRIRPTLTTILFIAATGMAGAVQAQKVTSSRFIQRGMPGPAQNAMKALAGDWDVKMSLFAGLGTPAKPAVYSLRTRREWIGGGRFLRDVTSGEMDGSQYYRQGTLGYSAMDRRYEWVTQDATNSMMMIYLAKRGSGPRFPASLGGTFTDQGIMGERFVGKSIRQRTVITINDANHHRIDIFFTAPGERERLVDRKIYTRSK